MGKEVEDEENGNNKNHYNPSTFFMGKSFVVCL
jgi:hypothetical protein